MKSKETKNKIVPKLRFPEFQSTQGWKEYRLNQISEHIDKKVGNLQLITVSITAGIGFVTQMEKFGRDISGEQYKNYIELNAGEFAYNKGYSKKYPQGCIYKLKEFKRVAVPNAFICFRLEQNFVADFFQGYFDNNYHSKQLQRFITSGARSDGLLNVNFNDFFNIILPIPVQKAEQQKIADCLSSTDELINVQSRKLEVLKVHRKGLMQQLFPNEGETVPKLRFPEFRDVRGWKVINLSELGQTFGGLTGKSSDDFGSGKPYVTYKQIFNSSHVDLTKCELVTIANNEKQNALEYGDVLFTMSSETPEEIGFASVLLESFKYPLYLNSFCFSFRPNNLDELIPEFSQYLFHSTIYRKSICILAQGITRFNISKKTLLNLNLPVPLNPKEQQKIADCLSSIDELISVQSRKLETLKTHKKGLMQQMFPNNINLMKKKTA